MAKIGKYGFQIINVVPLRYMDRGAAQGSLSRRHERVVKLVHTTDSVFLIVKLTIIRSKMGLET